VSKKNEYIKIHKTVVGNLKATINAHGPITKKLIQSAAKRITGALLGCKDPRIKK
jgi:hypothetical protein